MNELQRPLEVIETEINFYKKQMAESILKIGKLELGEEATLKQVLNHVAPMYGFTPKECLELFDFRMVK